MHNAIKEGYVQQSSTITVQVAAKAFFMSEPPDMTHFKPLLKVDDEEPKYEAMKEESPYNDQGFMLHKDLEPANPEKIIATIETMLSKRIGFMLHKDLEPANPEKIIATIETMLSKRIGFMLHKDLEPANPEKILATIETMLSKRISFKHFTVAMDAFVYETIEQDDWREGYEKGQGVTVTHMPDNIYGYFCPDQTMHVLVHYMYTVMYLPNMDVPYDQRSLPEDASELLGALRISSPLSYNLKIYWTTTY